MKTYSRHNFFKHTYCEFNQVELDFLNEVKIHYTSKSGSFYSYTNDGVFRYSNHWGRVADCRWKLKSGTGYKSQNFYVGFAKWTDFYALNELKKQFFITVDFELQKAHFLYHKGKDDVFLFTAVDAQKRIGQINKLFVNDGWAKYFDEDVDELRKKLVHRLISSNKTLQQAKLDLKH